jgi:cell pole-organizing protein PopZ
MTQAAKAQEPSMEEILASIRRIIADDGASKPAKAPEAAPAAKQQPAITAAPNRPMPPPAPAKTTAPPPRLAQGFRTIDGASDFAFTTKPESPPLIDRGLISNETIAAVDSAFNTLAHTIIGQNARTLDDLVKEMLRPMLKSWLDDNLPSLVERIVRAEIERVSRGR